MPSNGLIDAAAGGDSAASAMLHAWAADQKHPSAGTIAAAAGHRQLWEWLSQQRLLLNGDHHPLMNMLLHGHIELLALCSWPDDRPRKGFVYGAAGLGGHIPALQWLMAHETLTLEALAMAGVCGAARGHDHIEEWAMLQYWPNTCGPGPINAMCRRSAYLPYGLEPLSTRRIILFTETVAYVAAREGHVSVLQMLAEEHPSITQEYEVMQSAISGGQLEVVKWLHDQHCHVSQEADCAATSQPHVLAWLLDQDMPHVAAAWSHAIHNGKLEGLRVLQANRLLPYWQCYDLFDPAYAGDLEVVQLILPHVRQYFKAYRLLWEIVMHAKRSAPSAARYWESNFRDPPADPLALAEWLAEQHGTFTWDEQRELRASAASSGSLVIMQLAARSRQPHILWNPAMLGLAAAQGDLTLLKWVLSLKTSRMYRNVHPNTTTSRMLLLVHGHSWTVPAGMQAQLAAAQKCCLAFYGSAWRHRQQVKRRSRLGNLPDVVLKQIACCAGIDFSWTFSA